MLLVEGLSLECILLLINKKDTWVGSEEDSPGCVHRGCVELEGVLLVEGVLLEGLLLIKHLELGRI